MVPDSDYRIKLQVFEGPLDLLSEDDQKYVQGKLGVQGKPR